MSRDSALNFPERRRQVLPQNCTVLKQKSVHSEPSCKLRHQEDDFLIPADLGPTYTSANDLIGSVCEAGEGALEKAFEGDWTSHLSVWYN